MSTFSRILLILGGGFLLLIALLFCGNLFLSWKAQARLDGKLAELKAAGQPTSLRDLKPAPLSSEQNAAVHLARMGDELKLLDQELAAFDKTKAGKAWDKIEAEGKLPDAEQLQAMHAIVDFHPTLLAGLHRASACNKYASLLDFNASPNVLFSNLSSVTLIRWLAQYVQMSSVVLLAEHKYDEAAQLGIELLKVARLYGREPFLTGQLVSIAVRGIAISVINNVLQRGPISQEVRKQLEAELDAEDDIKPFAETLCQERAISISMAGQIRGGIPGMLGWPLTNMQSNVLDMYSEAIPVMGKQWFESSADLNRLRQAHAMQSGVGAMLNSQILAGLAFPSIERPYAAANRSLAEVRCLRILNALMAYAQTNGHDAPGIETLNLAKDAATDPFSGQPLKLKRLPEGWLIYSVMENNVDDGGKFESTLDYGIGPPGYGYDPKDHEDDEPNSTDADASSAADTPVQPADGSAKSENDETNAGKNMDTEAVGAEKN
ncbi:MAG TPA: hypothetical protein VGJ15_12900 [Pirellulales bacterium]|jgi:hypothetical protein